MALTENDLLKIHDLINKLLDIKLENIATKDEVYKLTGRVACVEDDIIKIYKVLQTELPIMNQHLRDHTDLLEEHAKLIGAVEQILKEHEEQFKKVDTRLNQVELAVQ